MGTLVLVKKSIYSPEFYRGLPSQSLSFSFKYFYSLVVALSLALTAIYSFRLVQNVHSFFSTLSPALLNRFPNELIITVKNGTASSNVAEPYFVAMPDELTSAVSRSLPTPADNFLVIDTKNIFTLEKFEGYKTLTLLTKDAFAFRGNRGEITVQSLRGAPPLTLDKRLMSAILGQIESLANWAVPLLVVGIFAGLTVIFSLKLVYLLFAAFLVWGILKARGVAGGYGESYQVGLHAMTAGLLFNFILLAFSPQPKIPFLFTLLMLVVVWVNAAPPKTEVESQKFYG